MKKIPKIIHQIWYQGVENIIEPYKYCHNTIKKGAIENNWKLYVWDEKSILKLINESFQQYLDLYNYFSYMIQKIDIAKYFILYKYGGVYIDMDMEWKKDFYDIIDNEDELIISRMRFYSNFYNNGILFSSINNNFWISYLNEIESNKVQKFYQNKFLYIQYTTGPLLFSYVISKLKNKKIKILDYEYFEICESKHNCYPTENTRLKNHFGNSWLGPLENYCVKLYSDRIILYFLPLLIFLIYKILI
tara:strand:+ start:86 stop:826 length:741 start_codon:yes stop_codon:yes gene_type:complete